MCRERRSLMPTMLVLTIFQFGHHCEQVFDEINSRKIKNELNIVPVFGGFFRSLCSCDHHRPAGTRTRQPCSLAYLSEAPIWDLAHISFHSSLPASGCTQTLSSSAVQDKLCLGLPSHSLLCAFVQATRCVSTRIGKNRILNSYCVAHEVQLF